MKALEVWFILIQTPDILFHVGGQNVAYNRKPSLSFSICVSDGLLPPFLSLHPPTWQCIEARRWVVEYGPNMSVFVLGRLLLTAF
jgi:hypothetical protein